MRIQGTGCKYRRMMIESEQEIINMMNREDYYLVVKNNKSPEDRVQNRWQVMRTKWQILNRNGLL